MFHSYAQAATGKMIDLNRAQFLFDKELARQAALWTEQNFDMIREERNPWADKDQVFWDYYCGRHYEKYGEYFTPHVDPNWE